MWPFRGKEARAQTVTQADPEFLKVLGLQDYMSSAADVVVTQEVALSVPAFSAAVGFLSNTIASIPLLLYRRSEGSRDRINSPLARLLNDAPNAEWTSFRWRRYMGFTCLTGGRSFTWIERGANGQVRALWPLDPSRVTVELTGVRLSYHYQPQLGPRITYEASEIVDVAYMPRSDQLGHYSPITLNQDVIGMAVAATRYGSRFLQNGGVPPFAVTGGFVSGSAMQRASDDLMQAVGKAAREKRQALVLPSGLEIKPIGGDPEKAQMIETQRFLVEQIARIFSLPPTFLQDLTHGTYSNTEQQDLHLVKHTLRRWVSEIEQELNLKLFGRESARYCEFSMDSILRGDFKTRMEGHATAIQHGIETPNEARAQENRPAMEGGDQLMIQGATVPLGSQPENAPTPPSEGDDDAL